MITLKQCFCIYTNKTKIIISNASSWHFARKLKRQRVKDLLSYNDSNMLSSDVGNNSGTTEYYQPFSTNFIMGVVVVLVV